ncbi:hypothetical protein Hypma_000923 [Hypsizygus marmoreus]|uniref:Uncharacterized protein n=1 Tax=Hypsizygus marmoreus TaxID=39966 RepID=A0A369JBD0_HYPMA|nr:hypothetical protein Hypma_000923 [Hypsizygus marmoreus]
MAPTPPPTHAQQLTSDLTQNLASALLADPTLTPTAAMLKVTKEMLANNPFVPPTEGCCPINDLPPELLAHIFVLGTMMEVERAAADEDEDEGMDEEAFDLKEGWDTDDDEEEREVEEKKPGDSMFRLRSVSDWKAAKGRDEEDEEEDEDDEDDDEVKVKEAQKEKEKKMENVPKDDGDMDWEDVDDDNNKHKIQFSYDVDEDRVLPFQVLVSHVCRHWREIALQSPALWTRLDFLEGEPFEKSKAWLERSKGLPLDIYIDCTAPESADHPPYVITEDEGDVDVEDSPVNPEHMWPPPPTADLYGQRYVDEHKECDHPPPYFSMPELTTILDIITPHVAHWRTLEVSVSYYEYMHILLSRLASCPAAPTLEVLELYHRDEDTEEDATFEPAELNTRFLPFNGVAPKLTHTALWGVHLDWDRAIPLLSGVHDLELAYHTKDVRPSYATFAQIIAGSPDLRTLTLSLSGPAEHDETVPENDWGNELLAIPSLRELVLCYHEPRYAIALLKKLSVPNVTALTLDFDSEDYSEFAQELTRPAPGGGNKSLLAGLERLKISGLPCNIKTVEDVLGQLVGLRTFNLNCSGGSEEMFFDMLMEAGPVTGGKVFCPNLHTISTTGIEGAKMKKFVELRKAAGVPVKRVQMSEEDDVDEKEEKWLRAHVEEFEFFEPSDSEEEFVDLEGEDDEMDEDEDEMEIDG